MKNEDVKIGMKVVPIRKTATNWGSGKLSDSYCWTRAKNMDQPYLFVVSYDEEDRAWVLGEYKNMPSCGDFFRARDFRLYEPPV
jgi:hypothetical protein